MCYKLTHTCVYCDTEYDCLADNYTCPTINADTNRNMCNSCERKLEVEITKYIDEHGKLPHRITIKELLEND